MDDIIKDTSAAVTRVYAGHRNLQPIWIKECAFADDLAILANSEKELKRNLEIWLEALGERNLKINEIKTKVMILGKTEVNMNIEINDINLEQVDSCKYLGVNISSTGEQETEIIERISNTSRLYQAIKNSFLNKKEISRAVKMSVYKTVFIPTLIFGCESWVLTKRLKSKIQRMEMLYLRRVLGVTRKDRLRNSFIREELKVDSILNKIEQGQLRWYGHLIRMNNDIPVKGVWEAKMQGKRPRGRPTKTWNDTIEKIVQDRGLTLTEAKSLARDKNKWKQFVYSVAIK